MPGLAGRWWVAAALVLALASCQIAGIGKGGSAAPAGPEGGANAFTGGAIEVTALDDAPAAGAPKPAKGTAAAAPPPAARPDQGGPAGSRAAVPDPARADPAGPSPGKTAAAPEPVAVVKTPAQMACEKKGGQWTAAGKSGARTCVHPTGEGGKQCRRQGDCKGLCLARSGTCAPVQPLFGCNDILQADGSRTTLCLD